MITSIIIHDREGLERLALLLGIMHTKRGAWQTGRLNPAFGQSEIEEKRRPGEYSKRFSDCWIRGEQATAPQWKPMP